MNIKTITLLSALMAIGIAAYIYYYNQEQKDYKNHLNTGIESTKDGNFKEAISDFTRSIEREGEDAAAFYNRGVAHMNLHHNIKAAGDFTRSIEINPEYSPAYYNRGIAYLKNSQKDLALKDFQEAHRLGYNGARKKTDLLE
ncbi:MAG: tetratricopeptide repeat protein [bacterium]|nr:tetratricopeptide repeat protein [bacterium]